MANKTLGLFFVFLTAVLTVMTAVSAAYIGTPVVDVRGQTLSPDTDFSVSRGETLPVHVTFTAVADVNDTQVSVELKGGRKSIQAETSRFDVLAGRIYDKTLYIKVPADIKDDGYLLHVEIASNNLLDSATYKLTVQRESYTLDVLSIEMPSVVAAGKSLTASIVIKNRGSQRADDVYIKASIPELGISKVVYAKDLVVTDTEIRDDAVEKTITLNIPATARKGTYDLVVEAYNSDSTVTEIKSFTVDGVGDSAATAILPKEVTKKIAQGKSAVFELTIVNLAETSQSYSIDVEGADGWALTQVSPMDITVGKEESRIVTIYMSVDNSALLGNHAFVVNVKSGSDVQQVNLMATVIKAGELDALMISAIILAVILVVLIVALIMLKAQGTGKTSTEEISYY